MYNPIEKDDALFYPDKRHYVSGVKVMRFGYELFSPVIPPPTTTLNAGSMPMDDIPAAVNPQDIIITSNRDTNITPISNNNRHWFQLSSEQRTVIFRGSDALAIIGGPNGHIETVRSPYSSLGDKFLSTTEDNRNKLPSPITFNEGIFNYGKLLPSSSISQSEIIFDGNPLGFFDENSALVEQHINSGITNSSASFCEPTAIDNNTSREQQQQQQQSSDGLVTTSFSFMDTYDEEDDDSSVETNPLDLLEQNEDFSVLVVPESAETLLAKLIEELKDLIQGELCFTRYNKAFGKVKKEYKAELSCALKSDHVGNTFYIEIKRLRDMANDKLKRLESNKRSKKRKGETVEAEESILAVNKKTRKNYNSDTIHVLMDWYLVNNGKPPSNQCKKELAEKTGKTDIQSKC